MFRKIFGSRKDGSGKSSSSPPSSGMHQNVPATTTPTNEGYAHLKHDPHLPNISHSQIYHYPSRDSAEPPHPHNVHEQPSQPPLQPSLQPPLQHHVQPFLQPLPSHPLHVQSLQSKQAGPYGSSANSQQHHSNTTTPTSMQDNNPEKANHPLTSVVPPSKSSTRNLYQLDSPTNQKSDLASENPTYDPHIISKAKLFRFEDFAIHRTLGTGSFGRVILVQHLPSQKFYAMKKLRKSDIVRLAQVEHTNTERALLARIDFRYLVKMICTFQDARHLYIVLEYVCGGELFNLLRRVRTLPPFVAVFYSAQVILALEYLHARSIIYRDLKPENILLDFDGNIKITDFGFAKIVPNMTYTLCGTPDYLAPEILRNNGYDRGVDWYALGVLIYEMLIGVPPFYHENQTKLYENIVNSKARFPPGFDLVARDLIEGLLQKDPTRRLGMLANGVEDIKQHMWFRDVQWDLLSEGKIKPPYKPKVSGEGDASNFDQYPDEVVETEPADPRMFKDQFPNF